MFLRYFLLACLIAYIFATFFWRSYVVWRKTGINPFTFKGSDTAHDFIGRVFKLTFAAVVLVVFVYALSPAAYAYLVPIQWLEHAVLKLIGVALLLLSLVWTVIAQSQMGEAWRIGVDSENSTPLVQTGLFRISRNPIYIGVVVTLLGLFLTIPNALTLLILVLGLVLTGVQIRLEEEHLRRMYPTEYAEYSRRVRRWI
jgi:protein-S-isoprenylcysteine O-methyltransferase Ste14